MALDEIGLSVSIKAELDRFEQNMRDAGRVVEASTGEMDRATKRAADSFARLEGKLDPAARALRRYEQDTLKVQRALDKGAVSTERAAQLQARLNTQYEQGVAKAGGLTVAQDRVASNWNNVGAAADGASRRLSAATSSSRNMGIAVQNAGYQIGDFAVQVSSGQGVLRPFIQQGTQLISMFGPWGAVLGAAGAVAGALATSLWGAGDATDSAAEATDRMLEAQDALNKVLDGSLDLSRKVTIETIREAEARAANARIALQEAEAILKVREAELAATQSSAFIEGTQTVAGRLRADIKEAQEAIALAGGDLDVTMSQIDQLRDHLSGLNTEYDAQIEQNEKLIAAWGKSEREAAIVSKTIEIMGNGFAGTEDQARKLAERLVDQQGRIDKLSDSYKDNTKELERNRKEIERNQKAFDDFIAKQEVKNESLQRELDGQKELNPLLEARVEWERRLGELTDAQSKRLDEVFGKQAELNRQLEEHKELQKEAEKQAKEVARIWENAADNIQDALADAIFEGKDLFESLKNVAKRVAAEIAAAMIFRPIIAPIIGGIAGMAGGASSVGVAGIGGAAGGAGSMGMMSGLGSLINGGLHSSFLTGVGMSISNSGIGQMLGLSQAMPKGGTMLTGLGGSFSNALGNIGYGGIGGMLGGLLGFGSGNGLIDMGLSTLGGIGGSMLATSAVGTSIGSALGLGGAALGPIGAIVGGLVGTIAGGLFERKPSNNYAQVLIDTATGSAGKPIFDPSERSQGTIDAATAMSDAFLQIAAQLEEMTGGTGAPGAFVVAGERDGFQVGLGAEDINLFNAKKLGKMGSFSDPEDAMNWLIREYARSLEGIDADYRAVIKKSHNPEKLVERLDWVYRFKQAVEETEPQMTSVSDMIDAVNEKWGAMIAQAKDLGVATDDAIAARKRERDEIYRARGEQRMAFAMGLNQMRMSLDGDQRGLLSMQLEIDRQSQIQNAQALLDAEIITAKQFRELSRLLDRQVIESLKNFDESIAEAARNVANDNAASQLPFYQQSMDAASALSGFLDKQLLSDASSLNPMQKIDEASRQYEALLSAVRGGDIGKTQALTQSAETLLGLTQERFSSSPAFADVETRIREDLASLGQTITSDAFILQQIEAGQREAGRENIAKLEELKEAIEAMRESFEREIEMLGRKIAA